MVHIRINLLTSVEDSLCDSFPFFYIFYAQKKDRLFTRQTFFSSGHDMRHVGGGVQEGPAERGAVVTDVHGIRATRVVQKAAAGRHAALQDTAEKPVLLLGRHVHRASGHIRQVVKKL